MWLHQSFDEQRHVLHRGHECRKYGVIDCFCVKVDGWSAGRQVGAESIGWTTDLWT
jgi:hypothetical protein